MKKVSIYMLFFSTFILSLCSCKDKEKEHFSSGYYFITGSVTNPEMKDSLPDMIEYPIAKPQIDTYLVDTNKNNTAYCFLLNATYLKQYMDSCKSPIIQFFLGEDTTVQPVRQLYLFAAMIDSTGGNSYLKYKSRYYALKSYMLPSGALPPGTLSDVIPTQGSPVVRNFYAEALSTDNAHLLIYNYQHNNFRKNRTSNSWLYNANDLETYITSANKIKYIEAILSINRGSLDLIFLGVDSLNNQMFFNYNGKQCVLENANPCPICEQNNGGLTMSVPKP